MPSFSFGNYSNAAHTKVNFPLLSRFVETEKRPVKNVPGIHEYVKINPMHRDSFIEKLAGMKTQEHPEASDRVTEIKTTRAGYRLIQDITNSSLSDPSLRGSFDLNWYDQSVKNLLNAFTSVQSEDLDLNMPLTKAQEDAFRISYQKYADIRTAPQKNYTLADGKPMTVGTLALIRLFQPGGWSSDCRTKCHEYDLGLALLKRGASLDGIYFVNPHDKSTISLKEQIQKDFTFHVNRSDVNPSPNGVKRIKDEYAKFGLDLST